MSRRIEVDAVGLLLLMDRLSDAFQALDDVGQAYEQFVESTVRDVEPNNVVDLEQRRLEKDPNEIYNNKGDK